MIRNQHLYLFIIMNSTSPTSIVNTLTTSPSVTLLTSFNHFFFCHFTEDIIHISRISASDTNINDLSEEDESSEESVDEDDGRSPLEAASSFSNSAGSKSSKPYTLM